MVKSIFVANVAAGMIFLITCVRFSVAHFSYALIIAAVFWGCEFWRNYRQHQWPQKVNLSSLRWFLWGMFLFYGSIWLSGVLIHDNQSASLAIYYAKYTIPFFLLWLMRINYAVDCGIKMGGLFRGSNSRRFGNLCLALKSRYKAWNFWWTHESVWNFYYADDAAFNI